jgi:hypothetical protein
MAQIGDDVQVDFSFTELGTDDLTDPDTVICIHRDPDLVETVYTYLTDDELVRTGVGQFRLTLNLTQARTHVFRPVGSGTVNKAQESTVEVDESYYSEPLPD